MAPFGRSNIGMLISILARITFENPSGKLGVGTLYRIKQLYGPNDPTAAADSTQEVVD
ncbi:MAG: hypothetical protein AAF989_10475 [Planctomycetota bacterium]